MNVLLVDDEDYVLDYLEEEIPWVSLGIIKVLSGKFRGGGTRHCKSGPALDCRDGYPNARDNRTSAAHDAAAPLP